MSLPGPTQFIQTRIISPIREFIKDSRSVGITLICCTVISICISNSAWAASYLAFWDKELAMPAAEIHLPHTILHLINDALMAVFFLLAGLEIKRELLAGELAGIRKAMLPVIAALGGMIVPAVIYTAWCGNTPFSNGWGIPMATDIAFSLGVLSLLGKKAPLSLRIFLTALAIIDDLGGILTIAVFYSKEIYLPYIALAALLVVVLMAMNVLKITRTWLYFIPGLLLWYCIFNSGIHATIAGILLALTIPMRKIGQLEHALHDPVNFIILPLFALANTAIVLPENFAAVFTAPVHHGILTGLFIGKPLGIFLFSFIAVKLGWATLPAGMRLQHLWGMGMVAGIGFTMSIFMATLAFTSPEIQLIAKVAILVASLLSGICGYCYLRLLKKKPKNG
jgi:NhaA family Na+:H+ antiporter